LAISQYNDLLTLKRKPVQIIKRIEGQYVQLLETKQLLEDGVKKNELATRFRVSEWIAGRLISLANSYTKRQLIDAVDACQDAFYLNNRGGLIGNASVENLIIKLLTNAESSG
jgi:DNA polymerase-3 subunit delta